MLPHAHISAPYTAHLPVTTYHDHDTTLYYLHMRYSYPCPQDTGRTARMLALKAQQAGETALFDCSQEQAFPYLQRDVKKSRNREVGSVAPACTHVACRRLWLADACGLSTHDDCILKYFN